MTRQIQKNEEVLLVEQMRHALGGIPAGRILPEDEPDVCIATSDRRIGIEVTELHQNPVQGGPPRRLQESECWGVVGRARLLAEASGLPVINVSVHFNESVPIRKNDRGRLVNELVQFVSTHLPDSEGQPSATRYS
jgi:hypothetical protein